MTFDPLGAIALAFLFVVLVLSARGCYLLWHARSAEPYLHRLADTLPWLSERSLVQFGAALPTIAIGMGSLTGAVLGGMLGTPESDAVVGGLAPAVAMVGLGLFLAAIPLAASTAVLRRPRFLVPPPLRNAAGPSEGP